MIAIVGIGGGVGNQLFQYAFARSLEKQTGAKIIFDVSMFRYDTQYKRKYHLYKFPVTNNYKVINVSKNILRRPLFYIFQNELTHNLIKVRFFSENNYYKDISKLKNKSIYYFEGNWQVYPYFLDVIYELINELEFVNTLSDMSLKILNDIKSQPEAVCIHFRTYKDIQNHKNRNISSVNYYEKSISKIRDSLKSPHYFVFADDKNIDFSIFHETDMVTFVSHNIDQGEDRSFEDLQLMASCKHFVIANSTFSWWSAFLSQKTHGFFDTSKRLLFQDPDSKIVSIFADK